ncbi:hypothetical protein EV360DRAFT_85953 [Lentinula raphanica]|nr:hypothetical protein EV360DRAFT_85953 [Lentinula raphanica]
MTRSTTRALAILLLAGTISSGVLAAPASMFPPSTYSSPTLTGAHAPPSRTTTGQEPSSGGSEVVTRQLHRRRLIGDDLAVENSEHTENGDADLSVFVNLQNPAELSKRAGTNSDTMLVLERIKTQLDLFKRNDPRCKINSGNLGSYKQSIGMALGLTQSPTQAESNLAEELRSELEWAEGMLQIERGPKETSSLPRP